MAGSLKLQPTFYASWFSLCRALMLWFMDQRTTSCESVLFGQANAVCEWSVLPEAH